MSLNSPEEAIARVAMRVRQGGHDVAPDVVRRRFAGGMQNFLRIYRDRVDYWVRFDNSGREPRMSDVLQSKLPDADMQAVPQALLRAGQRARAIARQTNSE